MSVVPLQNFPSGIRIQTLKYEIIQWCQDTQLILPRQRTSTVQLRDAARSVLFDKNESLVKTLAKLRIIQLVISSSSSS